MWLLRSPSCVFYWNTITPSLDCLKPAFTNADWAVWSHVDGVGRSRSDPPNSSASCVIFTGSWWWLWYVCWWWPVDPAAGPPPWLSLQLPALPPLPHQAGTRLGDHRPNRGPTLRTRGLHSALLRPVYRLRPLSSWSLRRADRRSTKNVS